jgi:hypothetical protein
VIECIVFTMVEHCLSNNYVTFKWLSSPFLFVRSQVDPQCRTILTEICFFICGGELFYNTVNCKTIELNSRMTDEQMIEKEAGLVLSRHHPRIWLKGLKKTMKNFNQDSWCPSWDSNHPLAEYESMPVCSVGFFVVFLCLGEYWSSVWWQTMPLSFI